MPDSDHKRVVLILSLLFIVDSYVVPILWDSHVICYGNRIDISLKLKIFFVVNI